MDIVSVTKELQLKVRIDDADKQRLEALAVHYSAPAATVVRMLVKEKYDAVIKPPNGRDAIGAAMDRYRERIDSKGPVPERYIDHIVVIQGGGDPFEKEFAIEALLKEGRIRKTKLDGELAFWREGEGPKR